MNHATVDFLDLTGVEQLTDVFFGAVQFLHKNSLFCQNVARITLQGCNHITDTGVKLMVETFPRLQTVSHISLCYNFDFCLITNDGFCEFRLVKI